MSIKFLRCIFCQIYWKTCPFPVKIWVFLALSNKGICFKDGARRADKANYFLLMDGLSTLLFIIHELMNYVQWIWINFWHSCQVMSVLGRTKCFIYFTSTEKLCVLYYRFIIIWGIYLCPMCKGRYSKVSRLIFKKWSFSHHIMV